MADTTETDNLLVNTIDTESAGTLTIGSTTATKVEIGGTGIITEVMGTLDMGSEGFIDLNDIATQSAPGSGTGRLYKKSGSSGLFWIPDTGPEIDVTSGGSSGIDIEYAASESQSSRTGTSYQQKVRLTFTAIAADYLIYWSAEVNSRDSGTRIGVRVQVDDTTTLTECEWNPDEDSESGFGPHSGFARVTLTAGSHDIDLDYRSRKSGEQVRIRRARLKAIQIN